jgi:hypothetical protein
MSYVFIKKGGNCGERNLAILLHGLVWLKNLWIEKTSNKKILLNIFTLLQHKNVE